MKIRDLVDARVQHVITKKKGKITGISGPPELINEEPSISAVQQVLADVLYDDGTNEKLPLMFLEPARLEVLKAIPIGPPMSKSIVVQLFQQALPTEEQSRMN